MICCGLHKDNHEIQQSDMLSVFDRKLSATEVGSSSPKQTLALYCSCRAKKKKKQFKRARKQNLLYYSAFEAAPIGSHVSGSRMQPPLKAMPADQMRTANRLKSSAKKS